VDIIINRGILHDENVAASLSPDLPLNQTPRISKRWTTTLQRYFLNATKLSRGLDPGLYTTRLANGLPCISQDPIAKCHCSALLKSDSLFSQHIAPEGTQHFEGHLQSMSPTCLLSMYTKFSHA
jgi:hypothetical protein